MTFFSYDITSANEFIGKGNGEDGKGLSFHLRRRLFDGSGNEVSGIASFYDQAWDGAGLGEFMIGTGQEWGHLHTSEGELRELWERVKAGTGPTGLTLTLSGEPVQGTKITVLHYLLTFEPRLSAVPETAPQMAPAPTDAIAEICAPDTQPEFPSPSDADRNADMIATLSRIGDATNNRLVSIILMLAVIALTLMLR